MSDPVDLFLESVGWADASRTLMTADASTRVYSRITIAGRAKTAILMQAPPKDQASFAAFLTVAEYLRAHGVSAPIVLGANMDLGLMLLEDFGDALIASLSQGSKKEEAELYLRATDVLIHLSEQLPMVGLPTLDLVTLTDMTRISFAGLVGSAEVDFTNALGDLLGRYNTRAPVTVLRDYHAENLLLLPQRPGILGIGVLDFQDAVLGPVGYDLVSLLEDVRRDVPRQLKTELYAHYAASIEEDPQAFATLCAVLCVQRNTRILGVFRRLAVEHGKRRYLGFLPRVRSHLEHALNHPELGSLQAPMTTLLHHYGQFEASS
jgi:aminoglycoside/choline kinase family phosphotransferase